MKRTAFALLVAAVLGVASVAMAAGPLVVRVVKPRVTLADILPDAPSPAAAVDMGAAPPPFGSRLYTRDEIQRALDEAHVTVSKSLPAAVRVVRAMHRLDAAELERVARTALSSAMTRGAVLAAVRVPRSADVAEGWDSVTADLPHPPHRTGAFSTTASLKFLAGDEQIGEVIVPIELRLTDEALRFDVMRGGALTLVVRRGLVEVTTAAVAGSDADIGSILQVTVRPSNRVVRARLVEQDVAELVDGP